MKKFYLFSFLLFLYCGNLSAQCTPVDCSANLPAYGGICDTLLATGLVNSPYSDSESFVITDNCFDAGLLDPTQSGIGVVITNVYTFSFTNLPNGINVATDDSSYAPPTGSYTVGCIGVSGTPTEAGVFPATVNFLADVTAYPFGGGNCGGIAVPTAGNAAFYSLTLAILPNPSFAGLNPTYCQTDPVVTLTPTGTTGGVFTGPGVTGSTFNPGTAGVGTHMVTYTVSAQQGAAIAPTMNSSSFSVTVTSGSNTYYADTDNDGYGDPNAVLSGNCAGAPAGYVANNTDCDDNNNMINPGANEMCDGIDNNCSGTIDDGLTQITYFIDSDNDGYGSPTGTTMTCSTTAPAGYVTSSDDCDDNNNTINPGANEMCDGIDNNCNGSIDDGLAQNTYYEDGDSDGYGNPDVSIMDCAAAAPTGYTTDNTDCDDNNNTINPGATEIVNNGVDEDCDGQDLMSSTIDLASVFGLSIYPNPASSFLTVSGDLNAESLLEVYDIHGKKVFGQVVASFSAGYRLDVSNMGAGLYILKITDHNDQVGTQKFNVIQ